MMLRWCRVGVSWSDFYFAVAWVFSVVWVVMCLTCLGGCVV